VSLPESLCLVETNNDVSAIYTFESDAEPE